MGDIKIEVYCESCPKACENFLALCASDYYNGSLIHRNIKGFIVQTGDPTNTGKGGTSIWGKKFEDEFKENLKASINDKKLCTQAPKNVYTAIPPCMWLQINQISVFCMYTKYVVDLAHFTFLKFGLRPFWICCDISL